MQSLHGGDVMQSLQATNLILRICELDNTIDFPTWFFTFSFFPLFFIPFYEREKRDTLFRFLIRTARFATESTIFSSLSSFGCSIVQFDRINYIEMKGKKLTNKKHDFDWWNFLSPPSNFYTNSAKSQSFSRLFISSPDLSNIALLFILMLATNVFKIYELSFIPWNQFHFRPVEGRLWVMSLGVLSLSTCGEKKFSFFAEFNEIRNCWEEKSRISWMFSMWRNLREGFAEKQVETRLSVSEIH